MQDRLRLKSNPPNVAVPTGARDLYVNSEGVLTQESPDGAKKEFYDMRGVEWPEPNPNIPEILTITGITEPVGSNPLVLPRVGDISDAAAWRLGDWLVSQQTADWVILNQQSAPPSSTLYDALGFNGRVSPLGINSWLVSEGAGQPTVTGDNPTGAFIGQRCLASSGFWSWDGTQWLKDSN